MKNFISFKKSVGILMAAAGVSVWAEGELKIFTAIEVEFPTVPGKVYQLQGSSDLKTWTDLGETVFGNGSTVTRTLSSRRVGVVGFESYRLTVVETAPVGLAPWTLAGGRIVLGDDGGHEWYQFTTETNGTKVSDSESEAFRYTFLRTGENDVQADLTRGGGYYSDRHELFSFHFTTTNSGSYVRDEYRAGRLKDRKVGAFTLGEGGAVVPGGNGGGGSQGSGGGGGIAEAPGSLTGTAWLARSGSSPDRLEFLSGTAGVEQSTEAGDDPKGFTYTYAVRDAVTAVITVRFREDRWEEYTLTFTAAGKGTFVRKEFRSGNLDDTDIGTFERLQ